MTRPDGMATKSVARLLRHRRFLICMAGAMFFALLLLAAAEGVKVSLRQSLSHALHRPVSIEDVDFNLLTGRLVVQKLVVAGDREPPIVLGYIEAFVFWPALFAKRLHLKSLTVSDCSLTMVRAQGGAWGLSGLPDSLFQESGSFAEQDFWGIEQLVFKNIVLHCRRGEEALAVSVDEAGLEKVFSWERQQEAGIQANMRVAGGGLELSGQGLLLADNLFLAGQVRVHDLPLSVISFFSPDGSKERFAGTLDAQFAFTGASAQAGDGPFLTVTGEANGRKVEVGGIDFAFLGEAVKWQGQLQYGVSDAFFELAGILGADDLDCRFPAVSLRMQQKNLEIQGKLQSQGPDEPDAYLFDADFTGSDLRIDDIGRGRNLLSVAEVSGKGFKARPRNGFYLDALRLSGVQTLERPALEPPIEELQSHIVQLKKFQAQGLAWQMPWQFSLAQAEIFGLDTLVVRNAEEELELRHWWPAGETNDNQALPQGFSWRADAVRMNGGSRVLFIDQAVSPAVQTELSGLAFDAADIDTSNKEKSGRFNFSALLNRYGKIRIKGAITPFGGALRMDLSGKAEGLGLPAFSPYAARYLGYEIRQGHLDADFHWQIENGQMTSEPTFVISKLEVAPTRQKEEDRLGEILGMPVRSAISLLQDSGGSIKIRLAIKGDLRDPSYDYGNLFVLALRQSVKKAVISYYAPLGFTFLTGFVLPPGTMTVGGMIVDWITTMRLDPLYFEPGKTELTVEDRNQLAKVAAAMNTKPRLRLIVKSRAALAELASLWHRPAKMEELSEEQRDKLLAFARQRSRQIKEMLVNEGVEAQRIYLAEPEIDAEEAGRPRADFYL